MTYTLRTGVSFCVIGDRAIFLDIDRDRYFCLGADVERAFLGLIRGTETEARAIARIIATGLIVPGAIAPTACVSPAFTDRPSIIDDLAMPRPLQIGRAFSRLGRCSLRLRYRGFSSLLDQFARRKARTRTRPPDAARIRAAVAGFVATRLVVAEEDRCLVRSFALGHRLLDLGQAATIVLGVKLQPFKAHCWVQLGDHLVNERHDVVRDFTPILVL